jgi:hypothetical protein
VCTGNLKNYLLALLFLPLLTHPAILQQLRGITVDCKEAAGKIELIGHPRRLLVKLWAHVSTVHRHCKSSAAQHCSKAEKTKGAEPSMALN